MKQIILMADIIKSREKESVELLASFKELVKLVNKKFRAGIISPLTITLGDEFQTIVSDIKTAAEIILFFEESLIHKRHDFKLRYVVHEGNVDTQINTSRAFEMMGEGLTMTREHLARLKQSSQRFFFSMDNSSLSAILNDAFLIFQSISNSWKIEKDYELISGFLNYQDYKKVAEILKKNRSLVWKREKSLNIQSYIAIRNIILTSIKLAP